MPIPVGSLPRSGGPAQRRACAAMVCFAALSLGALATMPAFSVRGAEEQAVPNSQLLGRGINLGNALEAPSEGAWGVTLKPEYFQAIKDAGFNSVRIPIRWSAHAAPQAPFTIAPEFFARVDWAIQQALSRNMTVVINVHHFLELYKEPESQQPRLVALWDQIATHYRDFPDHLVFELLNEPFDQLTDERWQAMIPDLLRTVRRTNPNRIIIVGPGSWNRFDHLEHLHLPVDDRHLIATIHYYVPMRFTHQGAPWVDGSDQWKNVTWTGTAGELATLSEDFDKAAAWASENRRPLYLGEFGAYQMADMDSRARWTRAVAREAEKHGFSWAYWEFCALFGAYDTRANAWRPQLLDALMPR